MGVAEGGVCDVCTEPLHLLPDSRPLLLCCERGHFVTVQNLLDRDVSRDALSSPATMLIWQERALSMAALAGRALLMGHAFLAADLQEAVRRIEERAKPAPSPSPAKPT